MNKELKEALNETKRHFDVVAEGIKGEIKVVAEQVASNSEKLEEHDQRFDRIEEDLETIKIDIGFIKKELKQKVDIDEFSALERRVALLESKSSRS